MAAILPGTRLGRYEVHEHVGAGTLGPIYRASDGTFGDVSIQVLTQLTADGLPAFGDLAPRLSALRHPNLAGVLDAGEHEGVPYVVRELAAGGALPQPLRDGTIGWDAALDVLDGVAAAIDHAHRNAVVHGSLRPDRVVLTADGRPLVADAGLEPLRRPPGALPPDLTAERAAFLAPEQAAGFAGTAASDRYALATLAYLLLAGRTPFAGRPADVVRAQVRGAPPPASALNPRLGAAVDRVLLRGLAREPGVRWQTGAQFVAALREALGGLEAPEPVAPVRRWRRWALGGVVLAALIGLLVWRAHQPTPTPTHTQAISTPSSPVTTPSAGAPATP